MSEGLKVIIAGSRTIIEMAHVEKAISLAPFRASIIEVVCGEATGVDTLGKVWARLNNVAVKSMPANWYPMGQYNRAAGFERNGEMAEYADALIAIWDGKSGGTKDMIGHMKRLKKPYFVHDLSKYVEPVDLFDFS